jgi:SAM-dependent methyltransferase
MYRPSRREVLLALGSLAVAARSFAQHTEAGNSSESLRRIEAFEKRANVSNPPEKIFDAIGVRPGMVVAEVGARHGRIAIPLARRVGPNGRVYANDIDREALDVLRERAAGERLTNIETVVGRVDDPLLPKGALDMAVMVWTYHEVARPAALLKSLAPAVKPGGRVALVEPRIVTRAGVEADAAPAGLELIEVNETLIEKDNIYILRKR